MKRLLSRLRRSMAQPHVANSSKTTPLADMTEIAIGPHTLRLDQTVKHERMYYRNHEAGIDDVDVAIAKRLMMSGDVVLDLGANIGFTALNYLNLGAIEVHAVEPHPNLAERLGRLKDPRLQVYRVAISSSEGTAPLILSRTHNQGHTLKREVVAMRSKVFGEKIETVAVKTTTIDKLFPRSYFDFIKVDIEGSEMDFLEGAQTLLSIRPPRILQIEIKPEFMPVYLNALGKYFTSALRVDYNRATGAIELSDLSADAREGFSNTPPNFIFTNHAPI